MVKADTKDFDLVTFFVPAGVFLAIWVLQLILKGSLQSYGAFERGLALSKKAWMGSEEYIRQRDREREEQQRRAEREVRKEAERKQKEESPPRPEDLFSDPIAIELCGQFDGHGLRLKARSAPHPSHPAIGYMIVKRGGKVMAGSKPYPYSLTIEQVADWVQRNTPLASR